MNSFHKNANLSTGSVFIFSGSIAWDWMALGKITALNSCAGDGFIIMGEDNTGKDLFITVPQPPPQNQDAFSLFEAGSHSAHVQQWRQHWENLRLIR